MCKLFAFANLETKIIDHTTGTKINKALRHLFYINSYGQTDGAGIMWMDKQGKAGFIKDAVPSPTLIEFKSFDNIKNTLHTNRFVAGHTRYSTVGSNSWENSHPFFHGRYMGMQNGTIKNDHKKLVKEKVSPCAVDSASVFWAFEQQGIEKTLDNYEGEGVFMFLDVKEKTFNIVKNFYRNLHRAKIKDLEAYIFSTDKFALQLACDRALLEIDKVEEVEDDELHTFYLDCSYSSEDMIVPPPTNSYYSQYYNNYYNGYWDDDDPRYPINSQRTITRGTGGFNRNGNNPSANDATTTKSSTTTDAERGKLLLENKDNVTTITKPNKKLEYVADCDMCGNPLMTNSLIFGDHQDITKTQYLSCSCCVQEVKSYSGREMFRIDVKEENNG